MFKTALIAAASQCALALATEQAFLNEPHMYVADASEPEDVKTDTLVDNKNVRMLTGGKVKLYMKQEDGTFKEISVTMGADNKGFYSKSSAAAADNLTTQICMTASEDMKTGSDCTEEKMTYENVKDSTKTTADYTWSIGKDDNLMKSFIAQKTFTKNAVFWNSVTAPAFMVLDTIPSDKAASYYKDSMVTVKDTATKDATSSIQFSGSVNVLVGEANASAKALTANLDSSSMTVVDQDTLNSIFDEVKKTVTDLVQSEDKKSLEGPCTPDKYPTISMNLDETVHFEALGSEYVATKAGSSGKCKLNFAVAETEKPNIANVQALSGYSYMWNYTDGEQGYALALDSKKGAVSLKGAMAGLQAAGAIVLAAASLFAF